MAGGSNGREPVSKPSSADQEAEVLKKAQEFYDFTRSTLYNALDAAKIDQVLTKKHEKIKAVLAKAILTPDPAHQIVAAVGCEKYPETLISYVDPELINSGTPGLQKYPAARTYIPAGTVVCIGKVDRVALNYDLSVQCVSQMNSIQLDNANSIRRKENKPDITSDEMNKIIGQAPSAAKCIASSINIVKRAMHEPWNAIRNMISVMGKEMPVPEVPDQPMWFPTEMLKLSAKHPVDAAAYGSYRGLSLQNKFKSLPISKLGLPVDFFMFAHILQAELDRECVTAGCKTHRLLLTSNREAAIERAFAFVEARCEHVKAIITAKHPDTEDAQKDNLVWWNTHLELFKLVCEGEILDDLVTKVARIRRAMLAIKWFHIPIITNCAGTITIGPPKTPGFVSRGPDDLDIAVGAEPGLTTLGHAMYSPVINSMPHSCAPNILRLFVGDYCICVALEPIQQNTFLTVNRADSSYQWTSELVHPSMYPWRVNLLRSLNLLGNESRCKCDLCEYHNTMFWSSAPEHAFLREVHVKQLQDDYLEEVKKATDPKAVVSAAANFAAMRTAIEGVKKFSANNVEYFGMGLYNRMSKATFDFWVTFVKDTEDKEKGDRSRGDRLPGLANRPPKNIIEQHAIWSILLCMEHAIVPKTPHTIMASSSQCTDHAWSMMVRMLDAYFEDVGKGMSLSLDVTGWFTSVSIALAQHYLTSVATANYVVLDLQHQLQLASNPLSDKKGEIQTLRKKEAQTMQYVTQRLQAMENVYASAFAASPDLAAFRIASDCGRSSVMMHAIISNYDLVRRRLADASSKSGSSSSSSSSSAAPGK